MKYVPLRDQVSEFDASKIAFLAVMISLFRQEESGFTLRVLAIFAIGYIGSLIPDFAKKADLISDHSESSSRFAIAFLSILHSVSLYISSFKTFFRSGVLMARSIAALC